MQPFLANLLHFGRLLHDLGLEVHGGRMLDVVRALEWIHVGNRLEFRLALRGLLVHRHEDLARFDEAFDLFWRVPGSHSRDRPLLSLGERLRARVTRRDVADAPAGLGGGREHRRASASPRRIAVRTYSPAEVWRARDFATFTPSELAEARELMNALRWDLAPRRTRRWMPGRGRMFDLRRLARRNMNYGGEPIELPRRKRKTKPRPLVVLCDVSGSMERYSRMLLQFVHAAARARGRVEAFVFATRLTRVTSQIGKERIDQVATAVLRAAPDWAGGTRIGEALRAFNVGWGRRVLGHGPVVLLISDGWDRGDPQRLRSEVAHLQRSCHRLVWLNPLLGSPAYEPLTRGLRAALPYVDDFLPAHNLASLESLAEYLRGLPSARPARRLRVPLQAP